jgi:hypothetical protein
MIIDGGAMNRWVAFTDKRTSCCALLVAIEKKQLQHFSAVCFSSSCQWTQKGTFMEKSKKLCLWRLFALTSLSNEKVTK